MFLVVVAVVAVAAAAVAAFFCFLLLGCFVAVAVHCCSFRVIAFDCCYLQLFVGCWLFILRSLLVVVSCCWLLLVVVSC